MDNKLNVNDIVMPVLFTLGVMGGWTFGLAFLQVSAAQLPKWIDF